MADEQERLAALGATLMESRITVDGIAVAHVKDGMILYMTAEFLDKMREQAQKNENRRILVFVKSSAPLKLTDAS